MSDEENVEDWFDRVMAESGLEPEVPEVPEDAIVLTEEDLRALFASVPVMPEGGFVYFDGRSGGIRGASRSLDADLASRFEKVAVDTATAQGFLSGQENVNEWMVSYQGSEPKLHRVGAAKKFTIMPTNSGFEAGSEGYVPVTICLVAPIGGRTARLTVVCGEGVEAEAGFTDPVTFFVTRKGSPEDVLGMFKVNPVELFSGEGIDFEFDNDLPEVDMVTKPTMTLVSYAVQPYIEAERPLTLPRGRFSDSTVLQPVEHVEGGGFVVELHSDGTRVLLREGGGRRYERELATMMVAFRLPGDPESLIARASVSTLMLSSGPVNLDLVIEGRVEAVTQLLFENNYLVDLRHMKPGLMVELHEDKAVVSIYRGGGERSDDAKVLMSLHRPGDKDALLAFRELDMDELEEGPITLDLALKGPVAVSTSKFTHNSVVDLRNR